MNAAVPESRTRHEHEGGKDVSVHLVEGPLRSEQSGMPILELLCALRNYHRARDFSHQERYGEPDRQSRQALSELSELQRSLQAMRPGSGSSSEKGELFIEASLNLRVAPGQ